MRILVLAFDLPLMLLHWVSVSSAIFYMCVGLVLSWNLFSPHRILMAPSHLEIHIDNLDFSFNWKICPTHSHKALLLFLPLWCDHLLSV